MTKQDFSNLTGKILIASPYAMEGNVFCKSLIYVVHHTPNGSVGLIFNHLIKNTPASSLFKKMKMDSDINNLNLEIYLGGPVEMERGFFLHSSEYEKNLLFKPAAGDLAVSSNLEILQDIAGGSGPRKNMFIVGYTGWEAGQMEFELENNLWIVAEPDQDLIFSGNSEGKWSIALNKIGVNKNDFIPQMGNC